MEKNKNIDSETPAIKVLVVDDEKKNIELFLMVLEDFSFGTSKPEFIPCTSAAEAIGYLRQDRLERQENSAIASILLDYTMPENNGESVINELKDVLKNDITQIILVTAQAGKQLSADPLENLARFRIDDYLDKDNALTERLPISLYNSIRLFLTKKEEKKLLRSVTQRNKELHLLYRLLTEYFSGNSLASFKGQEMIERMTSFFLRRLSVYYGQKEKALEPEAIDYLRKKEVIDMGNLFRLVNTAVTEENIQTVSKQFVEHWFEKIPNCMKWKESHEKLQTLHSELIERGMIERVDFELFRMHFSGDFIPYDSLTWKMQDNDLLHLFYMLHSERFFDDAFRNRLHKELADHFNRPDKENPGQFKEIREGSLKSIFPNQFNIGVSGEKEWGDYNPNKHHIYAIQQLLKNSPDSNNPGPVEKP